MAALIRYWRSTKQTAALQRKRTAVSGSGTHGIGCTPVNGGPPVVLPHAYELLPREYPDADERDKRLISAVTRSATNVSPFLNPRPRGYRLTT